jgi:hypothetical protein
MYLWAEAWEESVLVYLRASAWGWGFEYLSVLAWVYEMATLSPWEQLSTYCWGSAFERVSTDHSEFRSHMENKY